MGTTIQYFWKMKYLIYIVSVLLTFSLVDLSAQSEKKLVRQGNSEYEDGNFAEAEVEYRKALTENPNYYKGKFNLGDAMYNLENYEESGKIFNELAEANLSPEQKSKVHYNQGNNLMQEQKYGEAVEAFKKSLRLNPDDYDAKYNLEYARKKLAEQQQQQQQNQDQNQDQDKQDQDKQDQEDKQDQKDQQDQDKNDEQKDQDQKDQQDKQDQKQDQKQNDKKDQKQDQQQQQQQNISKQDAQRMLEALKNDEKSTLQKLQKEKAKAVKGSKSEIDW
jgi:tetratricopeptide (TPR) repeat protein